MKESLIRLGLSEAEAEIYLFLIKHKAQPAAKIAKETGLNRSAAYSILDQLIEKGLVNLFVKNGIKNFQAAKPSALKNLFEQKKIIFDELLPKLASLNNEFSEETNVELYQGIKGGLSVMKDILDQGKDYVVFGNDEGFQNLGTLAEQYLRKINEKKIKERFITKSGSKVMKSKHTNVKYLPIKFDAPAVTVIYGNKMAIIIFQKPYNVIVIKSSILAKSYSSLFEFLWKIAKK